MVLSDEAVHRTLVTRFVPLRLDDDDPKTWKTIEAILGKIDKKKAPEDPVAINGCGLGELAIQGFTFGDGESR
jgi:hypothetical protein